MILLVTDYGLHGPYLGQLQAAILRRAPRVPVVNLIADAPAHDPASTGFLLAAYAPDFDTGSVFLCVVDPGVGTGRDRPVAVRAGGRWFVGPDNGLFDVVMARARDPRLWEITWRPPRLSSSFHGRDLYAPIAAMLAAGGHAGLAAAAPGPLPAADVERDAIVYVDHFGNAMTGRRAATLPGDARVEIGARRLERARTFGERPPGEAFWYENANGLAEIAVNRGRAADQLGLAIGDPVTFVTGG